MTDTLQVNSSDTSTQSQHSQNVAPTSQAPAQTQSQEKLLRQSEVNDLVGRVKHESYEKGKNEALAEYNKRLADSAQPAQTPSSPSTNSGFGGMQQLTAQQIEAQIEAKIQERLPNEVQNSLQQIESQRAGQQIVQQFVNKMQVGKDRYSDFEDVVSPLQLDRIPAIVQLANGFDNTADIMYELGKNPTRVATLMSIVRETPHLANLAMKEISQSIQTNVNAVRPDVRAPLSQVKPSTVGADNGVKGVSDLRRQPWLRA